MLFDHFLTWFLIAQRDFCIIITLRLSGFSHMMTVKLLLKF